MPGHGKQSVFSSCMLRTAPFFRTTIRDSYWLCTIPDSYRSWLVSWLDTRLIHMIDSYELWLRTIPVVYKASLIGSRTLVSSRLIPCTSVLALEYDPFLSRTLLNRCYYSGRRRSTYRIVRSVTEELTLNTLKPHSVKNKAHHYSFSNEDRRTPRTLLGT